MAVVWVCVGVCASFEPFVSTKYHDNGSNAWHFVGCEDIWLVLTKLVFFFFFVLFIGVKKIYFCDLNLGVELGVVIELIFL